MKVGHDVHGVKVLDMCTDNYIGELRIHQVNEKRDLHGSQTVKPTNTDQSLSVLQGWSMDVLGSTHTTKSCVRIYNNPVISFSIPKYILGCINFERSQLEHFVSID